MALLFGRTGQQSEIIRDGFFWREDVPTINQLIRKGRQTKKVK